MKTSEEYKLSNLSFETVPSSEFAILTTIFQKNENFGTYIDFTAVQRQIQNLELYAPRSEYFQHLEYYTEIFGNNNQFTHFPVILTESNALLRRVGSLILGFVACLEFIGCTQC